MSRSRDFMTPLGSLPINCTSCRLCPAEGCGVRARAYEPELAQVSRRTMVKGTAGVIALSAIAAGTTTAFAQSTTATDTATAESCIALTPELTEGPYYIEDALLRDDITEGQAGIPFDLEVTLIDSTTCEPLADVALDIWHCNALGEYSGVSGGMGNPDTTGQTYLRGIQLSGADGVAKIRTVYPGWYVGRTTHIHVKVHVGGTAADGVYEGGTVAHTGQLFFDDSLSDSVYALDPYNQKSGSRTLNAQDGVLNGGLSEPGFLVTMTANDASDISAGFTGTVTLGIDPTAISTETGPGSGGPGGNGN